MSSARGGGGLCRASVALPPVRHCPCTRCSIALASGTVAIKLNGFNLDLSHFVSFFSDTDSSLSRPVPPFPPPAPRSATRVGAGGEAGGGDSGAAVSSPQVPWGGRRVYPAAGPLLQMQRQFPLPHVKLCPCFRWSSERDRLSPTFSCFFSAYAPPPPPRCESGGRRMGRGLRDRVGLAPGAVGREGGYIGLRCPCSGATSVVLASDAALSLPTLQ